MSAIAIFANKTMVVAPFAKHDGDTIEVEVDGVPVIGIIIEDGRLRVGSFDNDGEWMDLGEVRQP